MHRRGTYVPPDTPVRRRSAGRTCLIAGALLGAGALVVVPAVVATAHDGPSDAQAAPTAERSPAPVDRPAFTTASSHRLHWQWRAWTRVHATPPTTALPTELPTTPETASASAVPVDPAPSTEPLTTSAASTDPTGSPSAAPGSASPSATASAEPSATVSSDAPSPRPARASTSPAATGGTGGPGTADRLFAADSPWNTPIASDAATDPGSAGVVSQVLNNRSLVVNLNMYAFGIPFYTATSSTPRVQLNGAGELGAVPIDPSWSPNEGADHKMNVLDPATHTVFELQGYDPSARSVFYAVKKDYRTSLADGYPSDGRAGPTGSGLTQSGGVVRLAEMASGKIDHALSFITSQPVNRFRYPASHTDGRATGTGVEEGMRIQLDPTLDVDAIPGITAGEKAIAEALQRYGAYCTDTGGGNNQAMGIYVEKPKPGDADPYPAAGLPQDWAQLPHIPRDRLRVLAAGATPRPS